MTKDGPAILNDDVATIAQATASSSHPTMTVAYQHPLNSDHWRSDGRCGFGTATSPECLHDDPYMVGRHWYRNCFPRGSS
ncbi:MAG: hypothetical protein QOE71_2463 [Pseudonocardiales bacterium]|jgi:hypothetical protein|nr:hypothetical protein [Pseudonocardiales bacterium]